MRMILKVPDLVNERTLRSVGRLQHWNVGDRTAPSEFAETLYLTLFCNKTHTQKKKFWWIALLTSLPYCSILTIHTPIGTKKEQASKSDVAHFDGLLGIWPSTPPTTPSKWWSSAAPLGSSTFWCQCDWRSNGSITRCNADDEAESSLSQLKADFCLLPLHIWDYLIHTSMVINFIDKVPI